MRTSACGLARAVRAARRRGSRAIAASRGCGQRDAAAGSARDRARCMARRAADSSARPAQAAGTIAVDRGARPTHQAPGATASCRGVPGEQGERFGAAQSLGVGEEQEIAIGPRGEVGVVARGGIVGGRQVADADAFDHRGRAPGRSIAGAASARRCRRGEVASTTRDGDADARSVRADAAAARRMRAPAAPRRRGRRARHRRRRRDRLARSRASGRAPCARSQLRAHLGDPALPGVAIGRAVVAVRNRALQRGAVGVLPRRPAPRPRVPCPAPPPGAAARPRAARCPAPPATPTVAGQCRGRPQRGAAPGAASSSAQKRDGPVGHRRCAGATCVKAREAAATAASPRSPDRRIGVRRTPRARRSTPRRKAAGAPRRCEAATAAVMRYQRLDHAVAIIAGRPVACRKTVLTNALRTCSSKRRAAFVENRLCTAITATVTWRATAGDAAGVTSLFHA